jgi:hypothetical protein
MAAWKQKFFASFFKKEIVFLPLSPWPSGWLPPAPSGSIWSAARA